MPGPVAAALCPHPPLLVGALAGAAAGELSALRAACDDALQLLLAADPAEIVVVGGRWPGEPEGSGLSAYGRDVELTGAPEPGPLSTLLGSWLLARSGWTGPVRRLVLDADATPARCREEGRMLAAAGRLAVLAMGDASACRTAKAPGAFDPQAEPFDAAVAGALAGADWAGLAALDLGLCARLQVRGRVAWQVLAGALAAAGGPWRGELLYHDAPFGVGYLVATMTPGGTARGPGARRVGAGRPDRCGIIPA